MIPTKLKIQYLSQIISFRTVNSNLKYRSATNPSDFEKPQLKTWLQEQSDTCRKFSLMIEENTSHFKPNLN